MYVRGDRWIRLSLVSSCLSVKAFCYLALSGFELLHSLFLLRPGPVVPLTDCTLLLLT